MKIIRTLMVCIVVLFQCTLKTIAQDTTKITIEQAEKRFLEHNLQLLAERYNIDIADAAIVQARLWENPNVTVSGVNLWATKTQRGEMEDFAAPPLKYTDFSVELRQLIQTASKRRKSVNREKVSKEIALQEFEDILRGLKVELRKSMYAIQYSRSYLAILISQRNSIVSLVNSHKKHVQLGNIAKSELIRLQSSLIELDNEVNDVRTALIEQEMALKVLLNIAPSTQIEIIGDTKTAKNPNDIVLSDLLQTAEKSRPDMKQLELQTQFYQRSLDYEKSQRAPDITMIANYDRYSGAWKNFISFGVSVDLPVFNRNQGNIRTAKLHIEQSLYVVQQQQNVIRHEVVAAYNNYVNAYNLYQEIEDDELFSELETMLEIYAKNLTNRNINMIEYIDFMNTYRTSNQIMLTTKMNVQTLFEELQYTIGADIQ
ncbi:MAG: TolC family protein [Bacteroidetes bacterium]|nr:TolC family protein [Bacteroidota bacterium]